MDNDDISRFDQGVAFMVENFPPLWRRLYFKLVEEGFKEDQALTLLRTYIHGVAGGRLER